MTLKHTPGPWRTTGPNVRDDDGGLVCIVAAEGYADDAAYWPHSENARLISAAPDLLAALQYALSALEDPKKTAAIAGAREAARKAISKATGE